MEFIPFFHFSSRVAEKVPSENNFSVTEKSPSPYPPVFICRVALKKHERFSFILCWGGSLMTSLMKANKECGPNFRENRVEKVLKLSNDVT